MAAHQINLICSVCGVHVKLEDFKIFKNVDKEDTFTAKIKPCERCMGNKFSLPMGVSQKQALAAIEMMKYLIAAVK